MEKNHKILKCIIIDDEPPARRVLEKYVGDIPFLQLCGKCKNVFEASILLNDNNIDLMFLDISMPRMSGIEFLRTLNNAPDVIITSAYREYAYEGFELNVADYIQKPFSFERFYAAVNKVFEKYNNTKEKIDSKIIEDICFLKEDKITHKIIISDILYIESVGDYLKIHTLTRTFLIYETLKNFEDLFTEKKFVRVHKSFIVPLVKIDSIEGNMIKIGKQTIPIGSTYRKQFFDRLQGFKSL